ncbi:MAG TPA: hypothetical protein VGE50_04395 [Gammaproteobacteria bacterium]
MLHILDRKKQLASRLMKGRGDKESSKQLTNGSRIAVIGGGPAGSFFSYFLLRMAEKVDLKVEIDIYEPRRFDAFGPGGCNHCGGIVSESLVQILAMDGIHLPRDVVQRGIEAYVLHTDDGQVRIETPVHEKRIAAVYRGGGPRGTSGADWRSFDQYLLDQAVEKGAQVRHRLVTDMVWKDGQPFLLCNDGDGGSYDLMVVATGVNNRLLDRFEAMGCGYERPKTTTAFVSEFHYGKELLNETLGDAMHVFLLDIPRLEFAALIPKSTYATMCLLGEDIDNELVNTFLNSPEVRKCFPEDARISTNACHGFPRINIGGASQPFADRVVFIGDSGVTRLYKDGIGAAYRTGKAAAIAAVLGGVSAEDFRRHYLPACSKISRDNAIGKLALIANDFSRDKGLIRRTMLRMTANEQQTPGVNRHMSSILWDLFTGSAPYRDIMFRMLSPSFIASLMWNLLCVMFSFGREPVEVKQEYGN